MTRRVAVGALLLVAAGALLVAATRLTAAQRQDMPGVLTSQRATTMADIADGSSPAPPAAPPAGPGGGAPVKHHSARVDDIRRTRKPRPSRLRIARLGVDAPVAALGVADTGEMEVPTDAENVAWYEYGPSPGQHGSAVLAAHVDYNGRRGVFFDLMDLRAGDRVVVDFTGGRSRTFVVRERASIAKRALPVDELFRREGPRRLTLITCGGDFDAAARSYRNNVVVVAAPKAVRG